MSVTIAGATLKKMTFDGKPVKKWVHDGATVYSAEEIITLSTASAQGTPWSLVWKHQPVTGYTSVTLTITVGGTQDIFYAGIGTKVPSGDQSISAPSGSLYNVKSTNGDKAGTHTQTLSLSADATYYLYVGVYTGGTSNNGSVAVRAVFS